LAYLRYFAGEQQKLLSPHGTYIVYVRQSRALSAMDSDETFVQIRPKWHPERTVLLQLSGDVRLTVNWSSPKELQLTCDDCSYSRVDEHKNVWRDVAISFKGLPNN
jgi:hypothetical protein